MTEVSSSGPATRALLDAARGGLGPDPTAIARMRGKIDAAVTTAAPVGASAFGGKLGIVGLVAVAVGIGGGVASRERVASEPLVATIQTETPAPTVRTVREPAPLDTDLIELEAPAPKLVVRAPPKPVDLKREVELVDRAMTALRGGDANAALVVVHTHTKETLGAGQLAEDIAAIEIEALCKLHEPAVTSRLAAFDARWPTSAQRSRLTCP